MSDHDLIRRADALECFMGYDRTGDIKDAIAALPAVTVGVKPDRETFDAMCAMRDAINEFVPMPSLESDLLQGPENSVFCATVAEAVIAEIRRLRAALEPVAAPDPVHRPTMTDMMVDPDTLDAFMEANPLPPDPAAIREAALREALDCCTDYGFTRANECRDAILALIQQGAADDR